MALAVYAVVPAGTRVTGTGVFRDRLRLVRGSRASLVVEEMRPEDEPSREHASAFGDVLARLFEQGPVLPVRFGTTVEDAFAARDLLSQRSPAWGERLDAVRGHHEQVVHIDTGPRSSDRSSGRAYLASRAASLHADEQLLADLSETVAPYVTETRALRPRAGLRLACLVPDENSELLDHALDRWAADRGVVARTTGPWPPFSFSEPEETT